MIQYGTETGFERICAALSATSRSFWLRIGKHVQPDMLVDEGAKNVFKLCRAVASDHEVPAEELVRQRAAYTHDDGKLSLTELAEVSLVLDLAAESWDEEAILAELIPPVRLGMFRQLSKRITNLGVTDRSPRFEHLLDEMLLCDRLGEKLAELDVPASEFGEDTDALLADQTMTIQMPTGVPELDIFLRGGPQIGSLITILGDSKAGKSLCLNHFAAVAAMQGENVGYLSLELLETDVHRRLMAAITGVAINDLSDAGIRKDTSGIIARMRKEGKLGRIVVGAFQPKTLDEKAIPAWFDKQEKDKGIRIRYRIVDYGDLVISSLRQDKESEYRTGFTVWSMLKSMASGNVEDPNWVVTAAQSTRPQWKLGQPINILTRTNCGESRHKYQLSDLFITMTPQPDILASQGYIWYVDADRHFGATGQSTSIIPHQRFMGRMCDLSHIG